MFYPGFYIGLLSIEYANGIEVASCYVRLNYTVGMAEKCIGGQQWNEGKQSLMLFTEQQLKFSWASPQSPKPGLNN